MMKNSIEDPQSLLAIDIGSVATRVSLFDIVEGCYRFIAMGESPSTVGVPYCDISESLNLAMQTLEKIIGRPLLDKNGNIILPSQPENGSGVDDLVVTYTAGPELRIVVAGLLQEGSRQSVQRLAATIHGRVVERIGLNDRRKPEEKVDAILNSKADLILLSGGINIGASRAVYRLVEMVLLASRILPLEKRPQVIFAGNQALAPRIKEVLGRWVDVHIAPNIRPTIEREDIMPARQVLAEVVTKIRSDQIGGINTLGTHCRIPPMPASHAFGDMIQYLSRVSDPKRGVLGLDLGASGMTMAAAIDGYINLNVYPFGVGGAARTLAEDGILEHVAQWLPFEFSKSDLRDALWQKSLYPACLPVTQEAMAIELAAARAILQLGAHKTRDRSIGIYHSFERIIAAGSVLVRAPDLLQTLLTLLDGLQPVGITNLVIDQNGITASLGAAARFNPALAVQVLESRAYLKLATVICPVSKAKVGTVILEGRMQYEDGTEHIFEVEQGSLIRLPLENGKVARLRCIPHRGTWLAPYGKRKDEWVTITGGFYGAVIDARGRPLMLPADPTLRRETLHKWSIFLGIA